MTEPVTAAIGACEVARLLRDGELSVEGRLIESSNSALYCAVRAGGVEAACVYKPVVGERPLWDFPDGTLAGREVAAYEVSLAAGLDVVPATVMRDGPFGPGACQLWIDVDEAVDLVALVRSDHPALRRMALFDAVVNNADRKGGHLLPTPSGHVHGVDHGVCFSVDDKLRTVLWQWRGQPIPDEDVEVLTTLNAALGGGAPAGACLTARLGELLTAHEVARTRRRVRRLLRSGRFPQPSPDWPAVPWPPF